MKRLGCHGPCGTVCDRVKAMAHGYGYGLYIGYGGGAAAGQLASAARHQHFAGQGSGLAGGRAEYGGIWRMSPHGTAAAA
eukprot:4705153-Prymnesium_polylepis.1